MKGTEVQTLSVPGRSKTSEDPLDVVKILPPPPQEILGHSGTFSYLENFLPEKKGGKKIRHEPGIDPGSSRSINPSTNRTATAANPPNHSLFPHIYLL